VIPFQCPACATPLLADPSFAGSSGGCPRCGQLCTVPMFLPGTEFPSDFDERTAAIVRDVQPFTMTSVERIYALRKAVEYVVEHKIPGDIVECGVWKGGSMMTVARTLIENGAVRKLHLFDTFEGMPDPSIVDKDFRGESAAAQLQREDKGTSQVWAYSPIDEVQLNLLSTGYDQSQIVFTKGKVEDTIPAHAPDQIALLRLDTDWYESTYHELTHLYPRLSVGGVLIIDDYGHWEGARRAVDQYFAEMHPRILLNRIDYTARIGVKLA
jgi:O-methyltransferase